MSLIIQHTELEEPCKKWKNDLTYININNICLRCGGEASDKPITHVYCINGHVHAAVMKSPKLYSLKKDFIMTLY